MTDNIIILGAALCIAWYWIRDPQADYSKRLKRAFIMAIVVGLIVASMF